MRLIEQVWFNQHWAKWLLVPLLLPFSALFWLLSYLRRSAYQLGLTQSFTPEIPVVVVGNIGVGGNGKTPLVIYLVEQCLAKGIKVGVISRGYGGKAEQYPYLLDDNSTAAQAGDEPLLVYQRCHVPVVVGADRIASVKKLAELGCQLVIGDDGLQHYRLQRQLEIIVVDGKRLFGNGLLLPAGPLREGLWRVHSAKHLIINGNEKISADIFANCPSMLLQAKMVINLKTGEKQAIADFIKLQAEVNAIAGIGDPQRFFTTLTQLGFMLNGSQGFVDHHAYQPYSFVHFSANMPLLMTEKDAVKCQAFAQAHWWYLPVDAQFDQEKIAPLINEITSLVK